ncbi:hypothetical protein PIB30_087045 [Stylosanthes scabra]|uniref:Uncharacterized protein n=1 Tax=Stylosanthes scabra TaxID=79078 RepID=A0ABU6VUH5_9FABA|nr:hypothetical protein [Stylosanthes scabra]
MKVVLSPERKERERTETERERDRSRERGNRGRARGRRSFLVAAVEVQNHIVVTIFEAIVTVTFEFVFAVIHESHHCNSELHVASQRELIERESSPSNPATIPEFHSSDDHGGKRHHHRQNPPPVRVSFISIPPLRFSTVCSRCMLKFTTVIVVPAVACVLQGYWRRLLQLWENAVVVTNVVALPSCFSVELLCRCYLGMRVLVSAVALFLCPLIAAGELGAEWLVKKEVSELQSRFLPWPKSIHNYTESKGCVLNQPESILVLLESIRLAENKGKEFLSVQRIDSCEAGVDSTLNRNEFQDFKVIRIDSGIPRIDS